MLIGLSGFAKRASSCADCCPEGVLRVRCLFCGRLEVRFALIGIASGIGSDILCC